eukprot:gb/GFBE01009782.1/.p1 GENE.gb/GFBE01009782.1/~~gb/GFBE01009782.1/.p1  ORF type:complete len:152 (+),score=37.12 gb/GFBE01009782.1/:1-456(+)
MIVLPYGQPYTPSPAVRAAHVSNIAKLQHLPKPSLLEDESLIQQVGNLAGRAFAAVLEHAPRGPYTPRSAELCQVFGLDILADASGKAWLLEVNNYPAIASGTMEHVDKAVYTRLVRDVMQLVVLPKVHGADPAPGGWRELDLEAAAAMAE